MRAASLCLLVVPALAFHMSPAAAPRLPRACRASIAHVPALNTLAVSLRPRAARPLAIQRAQGTSEMYSEDSASFNPITSLELEGDGVDSGSDDFAHIRERKLALLSAVAGLDRGAAAGAVQRKAVLEAAEALERESNLEHFPAGLSDTDGLWRLVYSSALSAGSGSGGGAGRDSPAIFQTPDTGSFNSFGPGSQVGQVYARISSRKMKLENIVEIFLRTPVPFLPFNLGKIVLNLEHRLEVTGDREVKITLENVTARNAGGPARQLRLPPLKIPVLDALSSQGAGVFATTFCDGSLRITRGDRGEIRIFTKA